MALDVQTTDKWLIDQLRRLAGFDEVEEMASFIMTTFASDDEAGLASYLGELLGHSPDSDLLASGLCSRRRAEVAESSAIRVGKAKKKKTSAATTAPVPAAAAAAAAAAYSAPYLEGKKLSQKERARLNRLNVLNGQPPPAAAATTETAGAGPAGPPPQHHLSGATAAAATPPPPPPEAEDLDEDGFQRFSASDLTEVGGVAPSALKHALTPGGAGALVNCLRCGFINVLPAALVNSGGGAGGGKKGKSSSSSSSSWGGCSGCGAALERTMDGEGDDSSEGMFGRGFAAALALKDRLVQYDLESVERHAVYDDESDYFTSSAWLNELETEELQKRDAARHDSLHTRRRDMVVTIDLAGRRVVEEVAEGGVEDARAKYQARTSEVGAEERALRVAGIEKLKEQLAGDQQQQCGGGGKDSSSSSSSPNKNAASTQSPPAAAAAVSLAADLSHEQSQQQQQQQERRVLTEGDFANDTLTGRSAEVVNALSALFGDRKKTNAAAQGTTGAQGGKHRQRVELSGLDE